MAVQGTKRRAANARQKMDMAMSAPIMVGLRIRRPARIALRAKVAAAPGPRRGGRRLRIGVALPERLAARLRAPRPPRRGQLKRLPQVG